MDFLLFFQCLHWLFAVWGQSFLICPLLSLGTWFSERMNHHDGGRLHHVATDLLQFLPGPLVNAPQLLVVPVRDPEPVFKHGKVERTTWENRKRILEDPI